MEKPPKSLSFISPSRKKIGNSRSPTKSSNQKSSANLTQNQKKLKRVIHNINPVNPSPQIKSLQSFPAKTTSMLKIKVPTPTAKINISIPLSSAQKSGLTTMTSTGSPSMKENEGASYRP
jgi:hypothetical protein